MFLSPIIAHKHSITTSMCKSRLFKCLTFSELIEYVEVDNNEGNSLYIKDLFFNFYVILLII